MKRGIFSTEVKANVEDLKEFILSLGCVDVMHVVQSPKVVGAEATTSMTVIFKREDGTTDEAEAKDEAKKNRENGIAFDKALRIIEKASVPKDIDSIRESGKKLNAVVSKLIMALLLEAIKIKNESPTRAVRLIFGEDEIKNTPEASSKVIKVLKGVSEKEMPKEIKELLEWSRKFRPK